MEWLCESLPAAETPRLDSSGCEIAAAASACELAAAAPTAARAAAKRKQRERHSQLYKLPPRCFSQQLGRFVHAYYARPTPSGPRYEINIVPQASAAMRAPGRPCLRQRACVEVCCMQGGGTRFRGSSSRCEQTISDQTVAAWEKMKGKGSIRSLAEAGWTGCEPEAAEAGRSLCTSGAGHPRSRDETELACRSTLKLRAPTQLRASISFRLCASPSPEAAGCATTTPASLVTGSTSASGIG